MNLTTLTHSDQVRCSPRAHFTDLAFPSFSRNLSRHFLSLIRTPGDGSVPYESLSYAQKWKYLIPKLETFEIEGAEHRNTIACQPLLNILVSIICKKDAHI